MRKSFLSKFLIKAPIVWIGTFVLCISFFVISAIPRSTAYAYVNANSAGALFEVHLNEDGQLVGWLQTLFYGLKANISGIPVALGLTNTGEVQYEYAGGVAPLVAEVADSVYESPTGSAIVWAQNQYQMAIGNGEFTSFAYNSNDTDLYYVNGYTALSPLIGIWNWSRNIVYTLFIVVLIGISFLVLFRQQLNGQQYVTITNSLPSIVLSLVLITFSYPISALFIDLVSIGSNVVYNVMMVAPNSPGYQLTQNYPDVNGDPIEVPKIVEATVILPTYKLANGDLMPSRAVSGLDIDWKDVGKQEYNTATLKDTFQPDDPQMSIWSIFYNSNAKICGKTPLSTISDSLGLVKYNSEGLFDDCEIASYTVPAALHGQMGGLINKMLSTLDTLGATNMIIELGLVLIILTTQLKLLKIILYDYLILSFFPVLSPWIFLLAAIPNRTSKTIDTYFRRLGGSAFDLIIIYAAFLFLIILGYATNDGAIVGTNKDNILVLGDSFRQVSEIKWLPPMLGYSYGQIVGNDDVDNANQKIVTSLIIVLVFTAIPRIPEEIKTWMQVPDLPPIISGAFSDVGAQGKKAAGMAWSGFNVAKTIGKQKGGES